LEIELGRSGLRRRSELTAQRKQIPDRFLEVHFQFINKSSEEAMKDFRSLRGTMASRKPCSSRNSERWKPSGSFWRVVCSITRGPAKPMSAPGSAIFKSPSIAKLAVTPPVVGSVKTEM